MSLSKVVTVAPLVLLLACSAATGVAAVDADAGAGPAPASDASSSVDAAPPPAKGQDAAPGAEAATDAAPPSVAMPKISRGAPAFASSSADYQTVASAANDDDPLTSWSPAAQPAWIAYDLSGARASQRAEVLVVWNALHAGSYVNPSPPTGAQLPTAYTIEINQAAGGSAAPPASGWVQVAQVSDNLRSTVQTPVSLAGGNWVRMTITGSTDPSVALELDVYSAPRGASDSWMFMGDSVTYISLPYAWCDLPKLVYQARADRWPPIIDAAIGGTSTSTAVSVIDATLAGYPGRYVVLAYGTNDNVSQGGTFQMETLVQHVLSAQKTPVIPHMPWSDTAAVQANAPIINAAIDALYAKYPQIVRGPDLWTAFMNRTDLIPSGDIHPNAQGQELLRQQWAAVIAAVP